jgi:hypothetical protein
MFSYVSLEQRVPQDHPLRAVRKLTDTVLRTLSPEFDALYADRAYPYVNGCIGLKARVKAEWNSLFQKMLRHAAEINEKNQPLKSSFCAVLAQKTALDHPEMPQDSPAREVDPLVTGANVWICVS